MKYLMQNIRTLFTGSNGKSQLLFLLDGIIINAAFALTTGIVLSGYAIYLGADDFLTALLNNTVNYTTILSVFSFVIFERMKRRKKVLLTMNFIGRIMMFLIAILPLLFHNKDTILVIMTTMIIIAETIWGIYRIGWVVWMMSSISKEGQSNFIYIRTFLLRIAMSLVTLGAGFVLDIFEKGYIGFLIILSFSFFLSMLDIYILRHADDSEYVISDQNKLDIKLFLRPLQLISYRNYLLFIFFYYLLLTMASSFTPIYLIRYLKLDYKFISATSVLSQVVMILFNIFWAKVQKVKGSKFVLGISAFFTVCEMLILSFVTNHNYYLLFLSSIILGIGMGGFYTSMFTYRYEIMPEDGKTVYEGWFNFASGIGMFIAPFAGNALMNYIPQFNNIVYKHSKIQILYLISFILLCILLLLSFVKPVGSRYKRQLPTNASN